MKKRTYTRGVIAGRNYPDKVFQIHDESPLAKHEEEPDRPLPGCGGGAVRIGGIKHSSLYLPTVHAGSSPRPPTLLSSLCWPPSWEN